jgi:hypothetical protein
MSWFQRGVALAAAAVVALLAWREYWPFDAKTANVETFKDPSVWQYLLSDRYVLGVLQLGLVALALYIFVSVPALAIAARWAKAFGTSGVATDDAQQAKTTLGDYEKELADANQKLDAANETIGRMREQRDTALRLLRSVTSTTTGTSAISTNDPIVRNEGDSPDDASGHQGGARGA